MNWLVSNQSWYVFRGGKQYGPLSAREILYLVANETLSPDALVWRPGFPSWQQAGDVKGLYQPPPLPGKQEVLTFDRKPRPLASRVAVMIKALDQQTAPNEDFLQILHARPDLHRRRRRRRGDRARPLGGVLARRHALDSNVRKMVKRAGDNAKLGFPVHPHMLRHSAGYKLANDGQEWPDGGGKRHRILDGAWRANHGGGGEQAARATLLYLAALA